MDNQVFTISELNNFIRDVILSGFPQKIWICGEIQQFDRNKNKKHIFFELVEKEADAADIKARIGLVIFANRKDYILDKLQESKEIFELKDDIEVKFECKVDFYSPHGAVRLIVEDIDPYYTLGKLAQEKQKLIKLLREKGVLDKNKTLTLPVVPLNLGLITSYDSAAYNDFISELKISKYAFKVCLRDTLMQGKKAEDDVCQAIKELSLNEDIDLLVITRGGGSLADLSCFDSQKIAQAIADCKICVLSGIGHEINLTITDMAAHSFAKTPTAIARYIIGLIENFLSDIDGKLESIIGNAESKITAQKNSLKGFAFDLQQYATRFFRAQDEKLISCRNLLSYKPKDIVKAYQADIDNYRDEITHKSQQYFIRENKKVTNFSKMISAFSPEKTLKRGFSITRTKDGQTIKSIKNVKVGFETLTEVKDGTFASSVKKII